MFLISLKNWQYRKPARNTAEIIFTPKSFFEYSSISFLDILTDIIENCPSRCRYFWIQSFTAAAPSMFERLRRTYPHKIDMKITFAFFYSWSQCIIWGNYHTKNSRFNDHHSRMLFFIFIPIWVIYFNYINNLDMNYIKTRDSKSYYLYNPEYNPPTVCRWYATMV